MDETPHPGNEADLLASMEGSTPATRDELLAAGREGDLPGADQPIRGKLPMLTCPCGLPSFSGGCEHG